MTLRKTLCLLSDQSRESLSSLYTHSLRGRLLLRYPPFSSTSPPVLRWGLGWHLLLGQGGKYFHTFIIHVIFIYHGDLAILMDLALLTPFTRHYIFSVTVVTVSSTRGVPSFPPLGRIIVYQVNPPFHSFVFVTLDPCPRVVDYRHLIIAHMIHHLVIVHIPCMVLCYSGYWTCHLPYSTVF